MQCKNAISPKCFSLCMVFALENFKIMRSPIYASKDYKEEFQNPDIVYSWFSKISLEVAMPIRKQHS